MCSVKFEFEDNGSKTFKEFNFIEFVCMDGNLSSADVIEEGIMNNMQNQEPDCQIIN
jgi:hypothetical protein